jgi:hypothetical protein
MLRAVANAHPADYDGLIGQVFEDAFVKDGPSERMTDHGLAFNNATKAESARR